VLVGAYRVEGIRAPIPPRAPESARETAKLAFVGLSTGLRCARGGRTAPSSPNRLLWNRLLLWLSFEEQQPVVHRHEKGWQGPASAGGEGT
jgi:hypothetical protein